MNRREFLLSSVAFTGLAGCASGKAAKCGGGRMLIGACRPNCDAALMKSIGYDFIEGQAPVRAELALSFEKALNQSRKAQTKSKPAKNLAKCIELLLEIDTDVFTKLSEEELAHLRTQFAKLAEVEELIARDLPEA